MTTQSLPGDTQGNPTFYLTAEEEHHGGMGSTLVGFWIYLMSDALIFAALFAVFGVLGTSYAGGPTPREVFELPTVAVNTAFLLISSITFGFGMLEMQANRVRGMQIWLAITALFGIAFVATELHEFATLIHDGATPQRSAFLSSFFALVATHGLHVTIGICWIGVLLVQTAQRGIGVEMQRRLLCLSMFWHFLDIIWIGVFTFVYLFGVIR